MTRFVPAAVPCAALLGVALCAVPAGAGKFNKVLSVGDPAPTWADLPGTDGKPHSSADLKGKDAVVVVFTCNSCPVAVGYEDRVIAFANKYAAGPDARVAVVAINVNTIKDDSLPEMTKRAAKKKFPFPYLHDPSQEIARKFGANYTPEFFVLDKAGKVAYQGAMDDKSPPADATVGHLEQAVDAVLAGKPAPTPETLARGCRIRFNPKKTDE
jgi:peroxiredoxin